MKALAGGVRHGGVGILGERPEDGLIAGISAAAQNREHHRQILAPVEGLAEERLGPPSPPGQEDPRERAEVFVPRSQSLHQSPARGARARHPPYRVPAEKASGLRSLHGLSVAGAAAPS